MKHAGYANTPRYANHCGSHLGTCVASALLFICRTCRTAIRTKSVQASDRGLSLTLITLWHRKGREKKNAHTHTDTHADTHTHACTHTHTHSQKTLTHPHASVSFQMEGCHNACFTLIKQTIYSFPFSVATDGSWSSIVFHCSHVNRRFVRTRTSVSVQAAHR